MNASRTDFDPQAFAVGLARWWRALESGKDVVDSGSARACVDTDVLQMFIAPHRASGYIDLQARPAGASTNETYGADAAIFAGRLAEYILFEYRSSFAAAAERFLLLPGHFEEFCELFEVLHKNALASVERAAQALDELESTAAEIREIAKLREDISPQVQTRLNAQLRKLANLLLGSDGVFGAIDELKRCELLVREPSRLERLEVARLPGWGASDGNADDVGYLPISDLSLKQRERAARYASNAKLPPTVCAGLAAGTPLEDVEKVSRYDLKRSRDLLALSWLQTIDATGGSHGFGEQQPLSMISGARQFRRLAATHQEDSHRVRFLEPLSFVASFLQDMDTKSRSSMVEARALRNTPERTFRQAVCGLIETVYNLERQNRQQIEDFHIWVEQLAEATDQKPISEPAVAAIKSVATQLLELWRDLIRSVAFKPATTVAGVGAVDTMLAELLGDARISATELSPKLDQLLTATTTELTSIAISVLPSNSVDSSALGVEKVSPTRRSLPARNPPPILFADFPAERDYIFSLCKRIYRTEILPDVALAELRERKLIGDANSAPNRDYLRLLEMALLHTAAGRWHLAEVIFSVALSHALSRNNLNPKRITGHEAAYGAAVCKRICAGTRSVRRRSEGVAKALDDSFWLLSIAQRQLNKKCGDGASSKDSRFEAEEISQDTVFLWHFALADPMPDLREAGALSKKAIGLTDAARLVATRSRAALISGLESCQRTGDHESEYARYYVAQQNWVNYHQARWMSEFVFFNGQVAQRSDRGERLSPTEELLRLMREYERSLCDEPNAAALHPSHSVIADLVLCVLKLELRTGQTRAERDDCLSRAHQIVNTKTNFVSPIDSFRFACIGALATRFHDLSS